MKPAVTILLTAAAALGVGYLVGHVASPAVPAPSPTPQPNGGLLPPIPNPQFNPNQPVPPATNADALRAYTAQLLQQAATNPTSLDPVAMDQAAAELSSLGFTNEAASVTAAAAAVRAAKGILPMPNAPVVPQPAPVTGPVRVPAPRAPAAPGAPRPPLETLGARLPVELAEQMRIAMSSPGANPAAVRALAQRIGTMYPGARAEVATLLQHANAIAMGTP